MRFHQYAAPQGYAPVATRRSRELLEFLQWIERARLILFVLLDPFVAAALRLRLAVIVEILVADDLADGLPGLADDPSLKILRLAHDLSPHSCRSPGA